ncbi:MAG: Holliday junction DNA helicase RuvA [Proteobacteria bacterium]|nr:Holliday junction DNA helicase RuvA [Pseudomonadota bacterium]MBU1389432.1 Holliday junction DNA helicase RuvA [Pseudomonadota bacterium]MBU1541252.1 Holliday junction DNA helicase RuvA [Pseudomonadota bacterium]MBU2482444.1 Holliday junction DNA helicase RuvA [Pseudomonadota bacterium]
MIGYLKGTILQIESDGILLLAGDVGYEVLLAAQIVEKLLSAGSNDDPVAFYIYYHQTERQPKPVLIGFETIEDKSFFQTFITVDAIGPMKAVKAMTKSPGEIAEAIEKKDVNFLSGLNGIGKRTAEKIIATLHGKLERFVSAPFSPAVARIEPLTLAMRDISSQVEDVLVEQLGHSPASARRMVTEAFERNKTICTPEALFDEIFQEKNKK